VRNEGLPLNAPATGGVLLFDTMNDHAAPLAGRVVTVDRPFEQEFEARPAELHVYVEDVDAAFQRALAAGATSLGEPADRPYGERAGFVRDAFGNHWFIATHLGGSYLPEGLRTVTPFVHAEGTEQYIGFLKRAFGAVEESRHATPEGGVMYAVLRIGNAAIELGEAKGPVASMPSGFYLYVGDADAFYRQALAAGAKSLSPPTDQWYGDRVAAVEDSMGNHWFIARPA
jgi:PhnB protein